MGKFYKMFKTQKTTPLAMVTRTMNLLRPPSFGGGKSKHCN